MAPRSSSFRWPASRRGGKRNLKARLLIAVVIAVFAAGSYFLTSQTNPITGEAERVSLTRDQEIALGLQAAPEMVSQFGGADPSEQDQARLDRIGEQLVAAMRRLFEVEGEVYPFEFTLLADAQTVNAFALPGGQTFITRALYDQLDDAQLAGVMGHEIGHVVERHGAERMRQQEFFQQLSAAGGVAAGDASGAVMAAQFLNLLATGYSREHERESDHLGVNIMIEAGYDPTAMIEVMQILAAASGGGSQPSVLATHPHPEERAHLIEQYLRERFPDGVPSDLRR